MKVAVVVFPGSNCQMDLYEALKTVCHVKTEYVSYRATDLSSYAAVMLPGGFSYGDYLRSGAIASLAPVMDEVKRFAREGRPVFGTCNGFQILTEAGLLPGALKKNDNQKFICDQVELKVENNSTLFTSEYEKDEKITLPIAHADGCFYADPTILAEIEQKHQVAFRYSDFNPNGSLNDIAGITNERGNVFGMMPHPERAVETLLGSTDGLRLFKSLLNSSTEKVEVNI